MIIDLNPRRAEAPTCTACGGTGDKKPGLGKKDCGACGGTGNATDWT